MILEPACFVARPPSNPRLHYWRLHSAQVNAHDAYLLAEEKIPVDIVGEVLSEDLGRTAPLRILGALGFDEGWLPGQRRLYFAVAESKWQEMSEDQRRKIRRLKDERATDGDPQPTTIVEIGSPDGHPAGRGRPSG